MVSIQLEIWSLALFITVKEVWIGENEWFTGTLPISIVIFTVKLCQKQTNYCFNTTQSSGIYVCFWCTWLSIFVWDKMLVCLLNSVRWGVYTYINPQVLNIVFCIFYRSGDKMWEKLCFGWPVSNVVKMDLQNGSRSFGHFKTHCFFFYCLRLDISPVTWGTWE